MQIRLLLSLSIFVFFTACAQQPPSGLVTEFYDMSDSKFSVRAIAPPTTIGELVICKAVWFAEKRNVRSLSLSNPSYSSVKEMPDFAGKMPPDWVALTATAHVTAPNPDKNPSFSIAEKAPGCRSAWPWYR